MLTAYQIDVLRSKSEQLLDPIIDFLIEDIARRVSEAGQLTGTAAYDAWRLQNLGVSQRKIKQEIAKRLKISQKEAEKLLTQAAEAGYNYDISRFPTSHAVPLSVNSSLQQILDATVKQAQDDLLNMTQTIGFVGPDGNVRELTQAYQQACDFAFQKVSTGAQDYVSAIREATQNLAKKGIRTIDYESGVHTSIEAAARRNIMGGMGIMQEQISKQNYDSLGCDGWEISAHAGSAPDHEPIQGRQYSDEEFQNLNNSLVRRIGTLNCGHSAMPIILGVNEPQYTAEELEDFRRQNEDGITYEGKHYTLYEATQRQRKLERSIRNRKRRILLDETVGDKDKLQQNQIRLQLLKQEYSKFSKAAGLPMQHARMEAAGFDWKKGKAAENVRENVAEHTVSKKLEISKNNDTMKSAVTNGDIGNSTEESTVENSGVTDVHHVTRLDIEKYKCVSEDITTDEVVITDERIQHIKEHHPNDFERYQNYIPQIVEQPDYILESDMPHTAFLMKEVKEAEEKFQLIMRLKVSTDPEGYKNSVITFLKISDKKWNKYLRNKKILYKSE